MDVTKAGKRQVDNESLNRKQGTELELVPPGVKVRDGALQDCVGTLVTKISKGAGLELTES